MTEIIVNLPTLHSTQQQVLNEAERFNALCCGRRWGKTTLAKELILDPALDSFPIAYYAPTYKDLAEVWIEFKSIVYDLIVHKDEQLKQIRLITGGIIDFWSLEDPNSSRGRKYKRIVIDEAEKVKKLKEAWERTIRPTLADYRGDAWFLSTPKGINTYFHKMFHNKDEYDNWMSWQMPTSSNPYIDPEEIKEAENQLDPITFKQEWLAQFISTADKPFVYAFEDKHISEEAILNPRETVYAVFDFNVDPITCSINQFGPGWYYTIDEFRLENSDLYELCPQIKAKYGECHLIVSGDASGFSRNVTTKGNVNAYTIILQELNLSSSQLKVPNSNPPVSESRTLTNSIFARHPNRKIHPNCKYIIEDLQFVQVKDDGSIDKNSNSHRSHLLDTIRYMDNTFFYDFIPRSR